MPLPCAPPKTNPPLSRDGTTATHLAEPRISSGMPLSGADMISFRTVAADSALPAADSATTVWTKINANREKIRTFFMGVMSLKKFENVHHQPDGRTGNSLGP